MKTPKQYAELLAPVGHHGFYSLDIRAEDVEDLVAAVQAEALAEAAKAVEDLIFADDFGGMAVWNAAYRSALGALQAVDVTKHPDSSSS
jgi:hypothetical protein